MSVLVSAPAAACCLVVDDDCSVRSTLVRLLRRAEYDCHEAGSGFEALAVLETTPVHLVISDLNMPEMSGVELLQIIRARWPDAAVIMLSAVSALETAVTCLSLGASDYIAKPFQIEEIRARVEQALDKRRLVIENRRYQLHLAKMVRQQASRIEELFLEGVQTLVTALEAKDAYTQGHSARVSAYSGGIARAMLLSDVDVQLIELGAELHDVGKIGVREEVLFKPSSLTPAEYDHIMQHTLIGARILAPLFKNAPDALAIVRSHHERWDGLGLPDGLTGEEIPLFARIVAVADTFDAMTTGRPYRPGLPAAEAMVELKAHRATQFFPPAVEAFLRAFPDPSELPIRTPSHARLMLPQGIAGSEVATD